MGVGAGFAEDRALPDFASFELNMGKIGKRESFHPDFMSSPRGFLSHFDKNYNWEMCIATIEEKVERRCRT